MANNKKPSSGGQGCSALVDLIGSMRKESCISRNLLFAGTELCVRAVPLCPGLKRKKNWY
jgi:hypothetical protein